MVASEGNVPVAMSAFARIATSPVLFVFIRIFTVLLLLYREPCSARIEDNG